MSPDASTILQLLTLPPSSIARAMTCLPSNLSPTWMASSAGAVPGLNRRSKVIFVISPFVVDLALAASVSSTLHAFPPAAVLASYLQDWVLPSPAMVTVTFSHQGAVDSASLPVGGGTEAAATGIADDMSSRGTIKRSTFKLLRHRRSGDPSAAATCPPKRGKSNLVSLVVGDRARHGANRGVDPRSDRFFWRG